MLKCRITLHIQLYADASAQLALADGIFTFLLILPEMFDKFARAKWNGEIRNCNHKWNCQKKTDFCTAREGQ